LVRSALPLPSLLVALRTYQHLRRVVPGLAALDLQDLERSIKAALSPDEQQAVQRLLESHVAILAQAIGRQEDTGAEGQGGKGAEGRGDEPPVSPAPLLPCSLSSLRAAVEAGSPVQLTYVDTHARTTRRRVRPLRLEERWGQRYLVAHCELRQDERWFRLDRVIGLEIGD